MREPRTIRTDANRLSNKRARPKEPRASTPITPSIKTQTGPILPTPRKIALRHATSGPTTWRR